jgi:hypothetical protein
MPVPWSAGCRAGQLCFEAGDSLIEEAVVGPGGLQAFFQGAVAGGQVPDALFERRVLGGKPLGGVAVVVVLSVADLAEQLADPGALGADLSVGGFEGLLGVQPRCCQDASAWASWSAWSWRRWLPAWVMAAVTRSRAAGLS